MLFQHQFYEVTLIILSFFLKIKYICRVIFRLWKEAPFMETLHESTGNNWTYECCESSTSSLVTSISYLLSTLPQQRYENNDQLATVDFYGTTGGE